MGLMLMTKFMMQSALFQSVQDESRCIFQKYSLNTPRSYLSKSYSMSRVSRLADQLSFRSPTSSYLRF